MSSNTFKATCISVLSIAVLLMMLILNEKIFKVNYHYFNKGLPGTNDEAVGIKDVNHSSSNPHKIILLWNKLYEDPFFRLGGTGKEPFLTCNVDACIVTTDKTQVKYAVAVVFHMATEPSHLPKKRHSNQIYIQVLTESPTYHAIQINNAINLVMSYRWDSDIFFPYLKLEKRTDPITKSYIPNIPLVNKTKAVVWLVSNCNTAIHRENYVSELSRFIDVDIIGECGPNKCPKEDMGLCMSDIKSQYKFYISFENSFCVDYVTEKLSRPMGHELIPIVLGGTNYSRDAPPHSVINVLDYKSPQDLAHYLHFLSKNESAYLEYFQWKQTHKLIYPGSKPSFCKLCEILNTHDITKIEKTYINFQEWWFDGKCNNDIINGIM